MESAENIIGRCEVEGERVKIVKIVPEGSLVKKGQPVVWLDSEPFQKDFAKQEILWKQAEGKAKAAKGDLEVSINKGETDIDAKDLAWKLAKLDLHKYVEGDLKVEVDDKNGAIELSRKELREAEDNLIHIRVMVAKGLKQMDELRQTELQVQSKKFSLSSNENKLMVLEKFDKERKVTELQAKARDAERDLERTKKSSAASIEKAKSDLEASESTMKLEKATLDRIEEQLKKTVMNAPGDGIMVYFRTPWGDDTRIQAGAQLFPQQQIFTLPDLTKMQVKMKVHESVVKKIKPGLSASITIDAIPNVILEGKVKTVATLAQSQGWRNASVKEYDTIIEIPKLPENIGLKPGMSSEVKISIQTLKDVLIVPVQSVSERDSKHYAFVMHGQDIEQREVKVGESNEKHIQILEGLSENETVTQDARIRLTEVIKKAEDEKKNVGGSNSPLEKKDETPKKEEAPKAETPPVEAPKTPAATPAPVAAPASK